MSTSFTQSFDARVWAKAFVQTLKNNPDIVLDEGFMAGWFGNAIMRGFDESEARWMAMHKCGCSICEEERAQLEKCQ